MKKLQSTRRATVLGALSHGPATISQLQRITGGTEAQVRADIEGLRYHGYAIENVRPLTFKLGGDA